MIYHVSENGSDRASGTAGTPFRTINHAAQLAHPGDTVLVHNGTYREWIDPKHGGTSEHKRIIYTAAPGEHPVIKGSEAVTGWKKVSCSVWKATISNSVFGDWNPYAIAMEGDWFDYPMAEYRVHLGDVYINGRSMFEAESEEDLYSDKIRYAPSYQKPDDLRRIANPEQTLYKWLAQVDEDHTTIFCNFQSMDPNRELVEINVRPCCFYPTRTGINFITLRGFEIAHGACPWIPPTVDQIGMVGPHWSKGWIIENNDIHDAKCSAVSLGKEASTGDNLTVFDRKSGHRYQLEAVFSAIQKGWSSDTVGSHIVRNNEIHDCGQNAVVGHMGCINSHIYHNHIYNIGTKCEFRGSELGGVKFHGAIDTCIENNIIHDCTLGTWLDWQAQGTRLTRNIYYNNERDLEVEVSHGPCMIDNNLFLSSRNFDCYSQGNALVHNLFAGTMRAIKVLNRTTPYHFPHSTQVAGVSETLGGDDRLYNNIFAGIYEASTLYEGQPAFDDFATGYDVYSTETEFEEGIAKRPKSNLGKFFDVPQAVWFDGNAYAGNSKPSRHEATPIDAKGIRAELTEKDGTWLLEIDVPASVAKASVQPVSTQRLGQTRLSSMAFESPDGSDYDFNCDLVAAKRSSIIPGPFATLKPGKQTITLWKK